MPTRSEFERLLPPYLDQAGALSDQGLALIDQLLPEHIDGAAMPEATVFRLHLVSTANFRSGLVCLVAPETSLAASTLLRGLLEPWSHLSFIKDDGKPEDGRCRALRLERGIMKEWEDNARGMAEGPYRDEWFKQFNENKREAEALWNEFGCRGANRAQANSRQTLKQITKQARMEWVDGAFQSSSAVTHMYGVEYALTSLGNGVSELVWALASHRAMWLRLLTSAYGYVTTTAAEIVRPGVHATIEFNEVVRAIAESPALREASEGAFDEVPA